MALAANEVWRGGFLRDTNAGGALVVTTDSTGATQQGGFLRDPDGRLVVVSG
jgi:hypothetical protein